MEIYKKLTWVRITKKTTTKQKVISIVNALIIGGILGLLAKIVDNPYYIDLGFTDIGDRLGIWIFVATLLSVFSYSPKLAAVKVFAFFGAVLTVYYVYTVLFLNFFPAREIVFWSMCAAVAPVCAYMMWYSRESGFFSNIMLALPITVLLSEGVELRNAYLPIHTHYYLIPWLMGIYLLMIVVLLLIIPKNKIQFLIILPLSIILSFFLIKCNTYFGLWEYV
ncbi:DUF6518 family protein [Sporosarcina obsidiansis]|uniref:DUF6518 family protein n=1 Tax=Sporosarcina obsidiansis TaxID=2660748 RepID=UPI00129A334C|nr:DUF6518 family protein [Sporosarcina obsidiansis]